MRVPFLDLGAQAKALGPELEAAVQGVLASGCYILGDRVAAFEQALAEWCGCRFAMGMNSGTDALELSLRACGIGPGDDVLVPAFTFMATASAVTAAGATPILVDIDGASYGIDVDDAARRVTVKTKAIIPVHLYGQPCDVDGVLRLAERHRLQVIEDCAQAIGATSRGRPVGRFGRTGCFSFYPTKNLGAAGDGGAAVTNDPEIAERLRLLRNCGTRDKVHYETFGRNSRLDELQAAILLVKLRHLEDWNEARRVRAGWYREAFAREGMEDVGLPQELPERRHVYNVFAVRVKERDRVRQELASRGIETMVYYARPLHLDSWYEGRAAKPGDLPRAEQAAREVLALPMYPELSREAVVEVVRALRDCRGTASLFRHDPVSTKKGNGPSFVVLSLVEKGWAGARQATIPLAEQGHRVQHLVKGRLGREIVEIMPVYRGTSIHGLPPRWYRVVVFARLLMAALGGRLAWVIVDNDKARQWIARWFPPLSERVVLIQEREDGSPMILRDGHAVDPAVLQQGAA